MSAYYAENSCSRIYAVAPLEVEEGPTKGDGSAILPLRWASRGAPRGPLSVEGHHRGPLPVEGHHLGPLPVEGHRHHHGRHHSQASPHAGDPSTHIFGASGDRNDKGEVVEGEGGEVEGEGRAVKAEGS